MARRRWIRVGFAAGALGVAAAWVGCTRAATPPGPTPGVRRIDVLQYVVGDTALWPRRGNHSQNQVVDPAAREVCWVKYANPRTFECWRWDDQFIYHAVDHGLDGNTGESYSFTDGRWLPRYIDGGVWALDVTNRILWFDPRCGLDRARSGTFRYRQRAWIDPTIQATGDLAGREVLVLEYSPEDPAGGPTLPEYFYFARGAGWYAWDRPPAHVTFDRIGGPAPSVARDTVCDTLAVR